MIVRLDLIANRCVSVTRYREGAGRGECARGSFMTRVVVVRARCGPASRMRVLVMQSGDGCTKHRWSSGVENLVTAMLEFAWQPS